MPIKYLGIPLFKGRAQSCFFDDLVERISSRIQNWKSKLLSFGGKLTLIKSVLCSMPIHILSLLNVPKKVTNRIQKILANFLWSSQGNNRIHWISWRQICHPFVEGGLGIRDLDTFMQSLQSKFAWLFLQGQSLWAQIVRSKYGTWHHVLHKGIKPSSSHCWKAIAKHLPLISNNTRTIIRSGNSSFWKENWMGRSLWFPGCPLPLLSVKEALDIPPFLEVLIDFPSKRWPSPSSS
ncbi:hypothetical protein CFOL_v3_32757 [Cephalotus follicularis]|uniref:Zf-RVT domain-containing protein n=1 Tax=Cephalotus follicularis TaxID=3775 RepID=A0A1Q3DA58_CEPFO|nr:hypothetical protein CFOL_v3_32757 [Cephalotus follicularis]